jgi:hypothetical protein
MRSILKIFYALLYILLLFSLLVLCSYQIIKVYKNKKISNTNKSLSISGLIFAFMILIVHLLTIISLYIVGLIKLFIITYINKKN